VCVYVYVCVCVCVCVFVCVCVCVCVRENKNYNTQIYAVTESTVNALAAIVQNNFKKIHSSRQSWPSIRERIDWATERCKLHDNLAQARPQKDVNSRPKRFAANRKIMRSTSSPSTFTPPRVSNTIAQKMWSVPITLSSYFPCL